MKVIWCIHLIFTRPSIMPNITTQWTLEKRGTQFNRNSFISELDLASTNQIKHRQFVATGASKRWNPTLWPASFSEFCAASPLYWPWPFRWCTTSSSPENKLNLSPAKPAQTNSRLQQLSSQNRTFMTLSWSLKIFVTVNCNHDFSM